MEFDCINELEENPPELYFEVCTILLQLIDNVIKSPANPRYRRIRIENKAVTNKLLPAIGAMECLFSLGFKEDGDSLFLPSDVPLNNLQHFRDRISVRKSLLEEKKSVSKVSRSEELKETKFQTTAATEEMKSAVNSKSDQLNVEEKVESRKTCESKVDPPQSFSPRSSRDETKEAGNNASSDDQASAQTEDKASTDRLTEVEKDLLNYIEVFSPKMMRYENEELKTKAFQLIPKSLFENVNLQLKKLENFNECGGGKLDIDLHHPKLLLRELLKWFRTSFFSWVNQPECTSCQGETVMIQRHGSSEPSIGKIEEYKCKKCGSEVLFPRYEDPEILLQTRKGRCGEWANCFMLFCRALKWDTRLVLDVTDHVWVEVYFDAEKRWVHCDPCEVALDTPLMYEKGWKKRLKYVIAFSCEEVQDVTWRYSSEHQEVCARRKAVSEQALLDKILSLSEKMQSSVSSERKKVLLWRRLSELITFLVPPESFEKFGGRISGSKEWREARGELNTSVIESHYIWEPSSAALEALKFEVEYSTALDKYCDRSTSKEVFGWDNGVYSAESIFRKEEFDWKTVYLARTEGSAVGKIEWKFDLRSTKKEVAQIRFKRPQTVYENAVIKWYLCDGGKCTDVSEVEVLEMEGSWSSEYTLRAELMHGKGRIAWQHAQLFRQPSDSSDFVFRVTFIFKSNQQT